MGGEVGVRRALLLLLLPLLHPSRVQRGGCRVASALPDEASEQRIEPRAEGEAGCQVSPLGVADRNGRFEARIGFDAFPSSDDESACLVGAGPSAGPFCDIATCALRGAEGFVAELRIADIGGLDGNE